VSRRGGQGNASDRCPVYRQGGLSDGVLADVFNFVCEEQGVDDFGSGGRSITVFGGQSVGNIGLVSERLGRHGWVE
jgi:hypothetical protein